MRYVRVVGGLPPIRVLSRAAAAAGSALLIALLSPRAAAAALPQQAGNVNLLTQANLQLDGALANDAAGSSVASAGDVNGDGLADVIVGASLADPGSPPRSSAGSAYVIFGRATQGPPIDLARWARTMDFASTAGRRTTSPAGPSPARATSTTTASTT